MQSFQAVCAKNNQKIELIVRYNSLEEARHELHLQGYSIIEIKEVELKDRDGWVFYFEILINDKKKSGQIQSSDIFKAYVKLVDDLHYNVISIYDDVNITPEEKVAITSKVRAWYELYQSQNVKKEIKKEARVEQTTQVQAQSSDISKTFIGKEIQAYYLLIDKILLKIEYILNTYSQYLDPERKTKLQNFFITFRQLKNTTNIDKLRIISESALIKIWELEVELLRTNTSIQKKEFLNETNDLLKKFWSSHKVINPETDTLIKIRRITKDIFSALFSKDEAIKTEKKIDTRSFVYLKNLRELHTYKDKLSTVNKELFLATILFKKEKVTYLSIKKRLILQNIQLIEKRILSVRFSYTSIVKGLGYYVDILLFLVRLIGDYFLYVTLIYSLFFIVITAAAPNLLNYSVLYGVVILSFFSFFTKFVRNIGSLMGITLLFSLFVVFLQLNF